MTSRRSWEALQDRWASGGQLSESEERSRREYAAQDPLARREIQLFAELGAELERDFGPPPASFVLRTLSALRGSRLRLVAPDEALPAPAAPRKLRLELALAVAAPLLLGVIFLWGRGAAQRSAKSSAATSPASARAWNPPSVERSELVFVSGEVLVGGSAASIGKGTLAVGERVQTKTGHACLTIDPRIDVCLEPNSEVLLESLAEAGVRVRVARGTAVAALTTRSAGRTFSLLFGEFTATAHGTVFAVEAPASGSAQVSVVEGKVEVSRPNAASRFLTAHGSLALSVGSDGKASVLGRSEEARFWALLAPRDLFQGENLGVLEVLPLEPSQRVLVDERGPFALPLSTFVAARRHRLLLRSASGNQESVETDVEAGAVRRISAQTPAPANVRAAEPASAPPSAAALLAEAREKLVQGDARGARVGYERLRSSYPKSSEAFTVLVTLGKLELDLGAPARGLAAFEAYLKRGGSLSPEALSGKIRALRALGRTGEERAAIDEYLFRHANGFDAPMLKKRLEALDRP